MQYSISDYRERLYMDILRRRKELLRKHKEAKDAARMASRVKAKYTGQLA